MLGLIGEGTGIAAKVLKSMGASPPGLSPRIYPTLLFPLPYPLREKKCASAPTTDDPFLSLFFLP